MLASRSATLLTPCRFRQVLARQISSGKPLAAKTPQRNLDPHAMANELIAKSEGREQGTVAIQNYLTTEQKMKNFGLAGVLFGFVGWVWWYSMHAVGQAEDTLDNLADEARLSKDAKSVSEQEAQELAQLDIGVVEQDLDDDVTLAVAAPDDVAAQEEERNKAVLSSNASKRPLWQRIVFFWKRE